MKLDQLVKPLSQMTDEELKERLRETRHRRTVVRPAAKARVERVEKKTSNKRTSAAAKLLTGLSPEELAKLMEQLKGESE